MPALYTYKTTDRQPPLTYTFQGVNLTGGSVICEVTNLSNGIPAFATTAATVAQASANASTVRFAIPAAWPNAGDYIAFFIATTADTSQYRSRGITVRVVGTNRVPTTHPYRYGDGRGGYATVSDVTILMRNRDSFSGKTDEALIEMLLGDTAIELDSALEHLYETPMSATVSPNAVGYVRIIHKWWAFAGLYDLLIPQGDGFGTAAAVYREKGTQMLDDLLDGAVTLPDAIATLNKPVVNDYEGAIIAPILDDTVYTDNPPIFSVERFHNYGRMNRF